MACGITKPATQEPVSQSENILTRLTRDIVSLVIFYLKKYDMTAFETIRQHNGYIRRVPVRQSGGVILYLDVEQIDWLEAANQYVQIHQGEKRFLLRDSMSRLEGHLDPSRFHRIHRSAIVNLKRLRKLRIDSPTQRWAILECGASIQVSNRHWNELQETLQWRP